MTHDELIEAVARAIGDTTDFDGDRMASRYADSELRDMARAAIRVIAPAVLEEAIDKLYIIESDVDRMDTRAAIRAMKTRYEQ